MTNLSLAQIKLLGEAGRQMDSGEIPFVRLGTERVGMTDEAMVQFELQTGQTINNLMFGEILNFNLGQLRIKSDVGAAKKDADNP